MFSGPTFVMIRRTAERVIWSGSEKNMCQRTSFTTLSIVSRENLSSSSAFLVTREPTTSCPWKVQSCFSSDQRRVSGLEHRGRGQRVGRQSCSPCRRRAGGSASGGQRRHRSEPGSARRQYLGGGRGDIFKDPKLLRQHEPKHRLARLEDTGTSSSLTLSREIAFKVFRVERYGRRSLTSRAKPELGNKRTARIMRRASSSKRRRASPTA
jgi:hypothetical protein